MKDELSDALVDCLPFSFDDDKEDSDDLSHFIGLKTLALGLTDVIQPRHLHITTVQLFHMLIQLH